MPNRQSRQNAIACSGHAAVFCSTGFSLCDFDFCISQIREHAEGSMDINNSIKLDTLQRGNIDRRKLIQALGVAATVGIAASVVPRTTAFAASAPQMAA